ncbi:MAG: hypothetical protein HOB79_04240 [Rhodospirillaceae bacterium]|jgi:hypothetical protein|nr:hypothetical protein [Rhodospirillaceae bacterium]MBT6987287.1 hypothetical protein [Rhodospirillaceae bacterium]
MTNLFRDVFVLLMTGMALSLAHSEVRAAPNKPFLNVLGEAVAFREGASAFINQCANIQDGRIRIGSNEYFWVARNGVRIAKNIIHKTQACINQMYPKAFSLGWITKAEFDLAVRKMATENEIITSRFRKYMTKHGVLPRDFKRGQCVLRRLNLDDIANDTFC